MKISIQIEPMQKDTEIAITCNQLTPEIEKMIATLRILNQQMLVTKGDEVILLDVTKIIYVEAVERLEPFAMIGMNFLIAVILFVLAYKRSGLE